MDRLPPVLDQPLPRCVKASRSFWFVFALAMIMALYGPLNIGKIDNELSDTVSDQAILKSVGVAADARITDLKIATVKAPRLKYNKEPQVYYDVTYQFQPASTSNIRPPVQTATRRILGTEPSQLQIGQSVPILYDPGNPDRSNFNFGDVLHTSDPDPAGQIRSLTKLMVVIQGLCILFPVIVLCGYFRDKRVLQWWHAAHATILKEEMTGRWNSVTYQFVDNRGETVQGVQNVLPAYFHMNNPTVLYDPQNSSKHRLYLPGGLVQCCFPD